ncbi:MAG: nitroreductase family protein, partial [Oscillospiraceae bacterium]
MQNFQNETIQTIMTRRSIRKFKDNQIKKEELESILLAGEFAPCAGGRQSPFFVVCQNAETNNL